MAELSSQTLEEQLKCSICLDTYTNPKLLKCFHVYCQDCIHKLVTTEQPGSPGSISCPTCRQKTPVPEGGVESLMVAFHIKRQLKARRENSEGGAKSEDKASKEPANFCADHSDKRMEWYCETCGKLICSSCVSSGSKHHTHEYNSLGKAFEKYKVEIGSAIRPMEEKLASMRKALEDLDNNCSNVADQEAAVEATISDAIRQIHAMLDVRQAQLLDQLQQVTDAKLRTLEDQKSKLEDTHSQLTGAMDFIRESTMATGGERLMMRTTTSLHPDDLKPSVEADVMFEASPDVAEAFKKFGELALAERSKGKGVDGRRAKAIRDHVACELRLGPLGDDGGGS